MKIDSNTHNIYSIVYADDNDIIYDAYVMVSDFNAIFEKYKDFKIKHIENIYLQEHGYMDDDFVSFNHSDMRQLYDVRLWGNLELFVITSDISKISDVIDRDPSKIQEIHLMGNINYLKSFREIEIYTENMRIG